WVMTDWVGVIVSQPDVDGGLVGGSSLDGEDFARLCAAAAKAGR
ncbi:MAG: triose-phosphate isomerase, partial [Corynebacterium sp.]